MIDIKQLKEHTKDLRVLYVEDDELVRHGVNELLSRFFPHVDLACDGLKGLEKSRKNTYDIIISDINMPNMNGIEMAQTILSENPEQAVIIISAHNEPDYLLELINMGIQYYILKPLNLTQLTSVIHRVSSAIYNRRLDREYQESIESHNVTLEQTVREKDTQLNNQLYTDELTGLSNLKSFIAEINEHSIKEWNYAVLLLIDIDRLQYVNDLYGVSAGNQVLVDFTALLRDFAQGKSYEVFRTSGDQFVLLDKVRYIDTDKYEDDLHLLQRKIKSLRVTLEESGAEIDVDVTIGMSMGQDNPLEQADMALKYAKEHNLPFAAYNTLLDTTDKMKESLDWKHKIKDSMDLDRVIPVFHPIVDTEGNILKYEALMRIVEMRDEEKSLISPYFFLETAIQTKQYGALSKMVIHKVLDILEKTPHTISINLSYEDIKNREWEEELLSTIAAKGIGERTIFEITESESIKDYNVLKEFIHRARRFGIRIAIDDFGSGFSNFQQILEIHPEYIKIDGTLIKDLDTDPKALILAKAITNFSHELGIKVIAEFVHSKQIYEILRNFDVDEFQGFYFYEPQVDI